VRRLKQTEDMLRRHVRCFRWFQIFVVIVLLLMCAIIVLLATKFPAAIVPTESPLAASDITTTKLPIY